MTDSHDASPTLKLQPGAYIIHVTYGFSGTTRRVVLGAQPLREDVTISAGALTLAATVSDTPIPPDRVSFAIYVAVGTDPEGRLIVDNIKPNVVVRLPVGIYRIVSRYGDTNAIASSDIKVEPGKLIDVWGMDIGVAIGATGVPAPIVENEHDKVGWGSLYWRQAGCLAGYRQPGG